MSWAVPSDVSTLLSSALREPIGPGLARSGRPALDAPAVRAYLPHRGDALLIDEVDALDTGTAEVRASYSLERARGLLTGHFPGQPIWPGTQQVEAIGQAGLVLHNFGRGSSGQTRLVRVLAARFTAPVHPPGSIDVRARVVDDGLFIVVVGQIVQSGGIRSVAALQLISEESDDHAT